MSPCVDVTVHIILVFGCFGLAWWYNCYQEVMAAVV